MIWKKHNVQVEVDTNSFSLEVLSKYVIVRFQGCLHRYLHIILLAKLLSGPELLGVY